MKQNIDSSSFSLLPDAAGYDPIEDRLRATVRATIEALFEEELAECLGRLRYGRGDDDNWYRSEVSAGARRLRGCCGLGCPDPSDAADRAGALGCAADRLRRRFEIKEIQTVFRKGEDIFYN